MVKFYELWNPESGEGLGAAEALRQAQAYVRGQEGWGHPYFWAAWVLWGLPD
jgi:CHAT domain-containing protein